MKKSRIGLRVQVDRQPDEGYAVSACLVVPWSGVGATSSKVIEAASLQTAGPERACGSIVCLTCSCCTRHG